MHVPVSPIVRVFLDYLDIIEGFSKITKPMTELLGKDKKFKWMLAYGSSFQELKKRLTTAQY
jgi:hypothetical protein